MNASASMLLRWLGSKGLLTQHLKTHGLAMTLAFSLASLTVMMDLPERLQVLDEEQRQAVSFLLAADDPATAPALALLDLHTPDSFDPSPSRYADRYRAFRLAATLPYFCHLGTEFLVLDFYLDSDSWIGRHLHQNEEDRIALSEALSCFRTVLLPIREIGDPAQGFVHVLSADARFRYVHMNNLSSFSFRAHEQLLTPAGRLEVPHAATLLSALVRESGGNYGGKSGGESGGKFSASALRPVSFRFHPGSFPWFGFEEIDLITSSGLGQQPDTARVLFTQIFGDTTPGFPRVVLAGFSHDSGDYHDVAFNRGGPLVVVPGGSSVRRLEWPLTPGLFMLASQLGSVLADREPRYIGYYGVALFLLLSVLLITAQAVADRLGRGSLRRVALVTLVGLLFWMANQALAWQYGWHMPLVLPLAALALHQLLDLVVTQTRLLNLMGRAAPHAGPSAADLYRLLPSLPVTLVIAHHHPAAQSDPYKRLLAELDTATYWIQYLCLLAMADYEAHRSARNPAPDPQTLQRLYRPTLGNYLFALQALYARLPSHRLTEQSDLPLLARRVNRRSDPLLEALHHVLDLRNEWKHFASSNYDESSIRKAGDGLRQAYATVLREVDFLQHYRLRVALTPAPQQPGEPLQWHMLAVSGTHPVCETVPVAEPLEPGALYLCEVDSGDRETSLFLQLDPWLWAGECTYHRRIEVFFYAGFDWCEQRHQPTGLARYSGLTDACRPECGRPLPAWALKTMYRR